MRRPHLSAAISLLLSLPIARVPAVSAAAVWTALDTPRWSGPVMVEDTRRQRLIVLPLDRGGEIRTAPLDGATQWVRQPTLGGGPAGVLRKVAGMVYDPVRDQVIVIGLTGPDGAASPATFALTLGTSTWSTIETPPGVSFAGEDCGVAFDPTRERVLAFGGLVPLPPSHYPSLELLLNDTWALELAGTPTWHRVTTSGTPPLPRRDCSAVYDAATDRLIVFGGVAINAAGTATAPVDETWTLSFATSPAHWSFLTPVGPTPVPRAFHIAATDARARRMIVFGAPDGVAGPPGTDQTTWSLDLDAVGAAWSQPTATGPGFVRPTAAAFDSAGERLFVSGGTANGTAQYELLELDLSGVPAWSSVIPGKPGPPDGEVATAVVDSLRDRLLVLISAGPASSPVWARGLSQPDDWQLLGSLSPGVDDVDHFALLDPEGDRLLLFDGHSDSRSDTALVDVWSWDLSGPPVLVKLPRLGTAPGRRSGAMAAVDRAGRRLLVFGGEYFDSTAHDLLPEVFALSLDAAPTWSTLATTGVAPPTTPRQTVVAYSVTNDFLVMGAVMRDPSNLPQTPPVWALSLADLAWRPLPVTGEAPFAGGFLAVPDQAYARVITVQAFGGPPRLATFDPARSKWQTLAALFDPPPGGATAGFALDAARDRELLVTPKGLWALSPDSPANPQLVLVDAHLEQSAEVLHWSSPDHSVQQAVMQLRFNGGAWVDEGLMTPENFTDFVVAWPLISPGVYEFRLAVASSDGPQYFGYVRVQANKVPPFDPGVATLRSLTNPSSRALTMQFFVRGAEYDPNARLELFDLQGRRLASHTIGVVGGSWQTIDLGAGLNLRPGLYVVRLAQRGIGEVRTRVVVL